MKNSLLAIFLLLSFGLSAQLISGKVINDKNEPLVGANIYWLGTTIGASTNEQGIFQLSTEGISDQRLIASFVGYVSDTIDVSAQSSIDFKLEEIEALKGVVVKGKRDGVVFSNLNVIKTEQLTQTELKKAACCDLAGCFGTQSSVQSQTTNVITNSKELRILGLSGVYNQVLIDDLPMIQGLSFTYGISSTPGTLVDNIFIAKGANSVLQGYESISGQINVTTKEADNTDKLLLNLYANSFMETHLNANYAFEKGKWNNLTAFHMVQPAKKVDRDQDTFLDVPLLTRYMVSNKWKYGNSSDWGWHSKIGVRFLKEQRTGGQTFFDADSDIGSTNAYGQTVSINQPEIWTKTGYRFDDTNAVTFSASSFHQQQASNFGLVKYDAQQTSVYANARYELNYKDHNLKTGFSFRHLNLQEDISFTNDNSQQTYAGNYQRKEVIPGIFAENTLQFLDGRLTWMAGIRGDHHNQFGFKITPRTLLKYDFSERSVIRANIGTGWRTVNLFSENINLLISSRDVIFEEALQPEEAVNLGTNFLQKFETTHFSGYFSTDFYHTNFQNQIFPDYDSDPSKAIIKNFTGTSIGNGFQAEISVKIREQVELKAGYNYLDVYREIDGQKQLLPFNAKHRMLFVFNYSPPSNKFNLDVNLHWFGQQRLPNTKSNPIEFQRPGFSDPYTLVNAQFTYFFKDIEVYAGCENIFDFRQERPIISWENPFSPYFDTSSVWGPTRGREIYIGGRYYLRKK